MISRTLIACFLVVSGVCAEATAIEGSKIAALACAYVDSVAATSGHRDREVEATSIPTDRKALSAPLRLHGPQAPIDSGIHMVSLFSRPEGGREVRVATVGVRMTAFASTYCAVHALSRGESIGSNDIEVRRAPRAPGAVLEPPIGMRARRAIASGTPLRSSDLEPVPQILAGDRVEATLERGGLRLVLAGRALEDAATGESFRLHDPLMRRALRARAQAPGKAVLEP